jgi:hypothetical protein
MSRQAFDLINAGKRSPLFLEKILKFDKFQNKQLERLRKCKSVSRE